MTAYYNEFDPFAAQWLRKLIDAGLIAPGVVDDRSITDVTPSDLSGFTQCHFFAGIGGWSLALRLAGVPDTFPLWTGSPPCQPFSVAGTGAGKRDSRHLAPTFLDLVSECRPQLIFGEQVAAAVTKDQWADSLLIELAEEGYSSGFAVLPACGVGAPHKRDRLFFGAALLEHASSFGWEPGRCGYYARNDRQQPAATGENCRVANRSRECVEASGQSGATGWSESSNSRTDSGVADFYGERLQGERPYSNQKGREKSDIRQAGLRDGAGDKSANSSNSPWSDADWLGCRDGKFRPVESGTFPLANGIPARVGRLRGYGNAIVPQVAAEFITAFMAASGEAAA